MQGKSETCTVVPRLPGGGLTPELLANLARVMDKYHIPAVRITAAQRLALDGVRPEVVQALGEELGLAVDPLSGPGIHYVAACAGADGCRFGLRDARQLARRLEQKLAGLELPAKAKLAVSGCPRNCGQGYVRDLGVFANTGGWVLTFGGNAGGRPRIGDVVAEKLSDDEVMALAMKCLDYYRVHGLKKERTARFMERIGIDQLRKEVY